MTPTVGDGVTTLADKGYIGAGIGVHTPVKGHHEHCVFGDTLAGRGDVDDGLAGDESSDKSEGRETVDPWGSPQECLGMMTIASSENQ